MAKLKANKQKGQNRYQLSFYLDDRADDQLIRDLREKIDQCPGDRAAVWEDRTARQDEASWTLLLREGELGSLFNPAELLQQPELEKEAPLRYYQCIFKNKKDLSRDGLMLPTPTFDRLLKLLGPDRLSVSSAELLLEKMGYNRLEILVNQPSPFAATERKVRRPLEALRMKLAWHTSLALKEARAGRKGQAWLSSEHPLFRFAFLLFAVFCFIILPLLSLDAGLSGDDTKHYQHAIKVHRYFTEGDLSALDDPKYKLNYYGQSFDYFTYLLIRLLGLEDSPYEARHFMVALTGAAAILITGLFARLLAGYRAGLLAMVLMFFSPRFLGHAYNNPMDVPFLLGNVFTLYHLALLLRGLPKISLKHAVWISIGLAWTIGIRIGGLLLIPYIFMFSGLWMLAIRGPMKVFSATWWGLAGKGILSLLLISVAGYLMSLLTWPYALQDIVNHPMKSFQVMTNIQVSLRVLYDSAIHWSDKLPWHYIPRNILITVPTVILLGLLLSIPAAWMQRKKAGFWYFMLWFTILFPVVFIIIRESNVYGGWRHMMFILPSIIILAALGLDTLSKHMGRAGKSALAVLLLAGILHPAIHLIRNHPNTYIYFNELSGGISRTFGHFETDYYAASLKPATDHFLREVLTQHHPASQLKVISNSDISYYLRRHRQNLTPVYQSYYRLGRADWDYAILYCNYIHPYQLQKGLWPPKNTIHEVKVGKVTVAAVVRRENKYDYQGIQLFAEARREHSEAKLDQSVLLLERAVERDPYNVNALLSLGDAYITKLRFLDAIRLADTLLAFYPDYDKAYNLKGHACMVEYQYLKNPELLVEAISWFNRAIRSNIKFSTGYYNLGKCYQTIGDYNNAIYNMKLAIRYNGNFREALEGLAELYELTGDKESAKSVRSRLGRN